MKNLHRSRIMLFFNRSAPLLTLFSALSVINILGGIPGASWSRSVSDSMHQGIPCIILSISSIDSHLSAECGCQYVETTGSVVFHGTKDFNGQLSPFVSYDIATEGTTKWKTIGNFTGRNNPSAIELSSVNSRVLFHVDMEPFRSSIGKVRWGRLVFENGNTARFKIDDLLPTGNDPDAVGNFRQDITDIESNRFESSFSLVAVTSFSQHLIGDFVFVGGQQGSAVEIKGTRLLDGDFWPAVTLLVGDSDQNWQILGKPTNEGVLAPLRIVHQNPLQELRIPLDLYKPVIGKFKYGKIIFSDGKFAVFEIANLKPR